MTYIPFTYFLHWTKLNTHYYGVRYAKGCSPSDIMTTYFTSSKYVKAFIKENGLPDVIEIEKVFTTSKEARLWENFQLKNLDLVNDNSYLNKTDNISIDPTLCGYAKGKTYEEMYGIEKANSLKDSRSQSNRKRSPELRKTISEKIRKSTIGTRHGSLNGNSKSYSIGDKIFLTQKEARTYLKASYNKFQKLLRIGTVKEI